MFGRKKPVPVLKPDIEFVSIPVEIQKLMSKAIGRDSAPKVRPFYVSRVTKPTDPSWRYMSSCVIMADSLEHAKHRLHLALRQRASAAKPEDYVVSEIPADAEGRDHGIVMTTMVEPN